jgi:hypothetical protein
MWIPGASRGGVSKYAFCNAGNGRPNRAFSRLPNRSLAALKNPSKIPFIQQLDGRDFALGAMRLSWHKWQRFSLEFQR